MTFPPTRRNILPLVLLAASIASGSANARGDEKATATATPSAASAGVAAAGAGAGAGGSGASKYLGGLSLVDQNGQSLDLYRDLVAGHSVVINSFYTHCEASCPVVMSTLQRLQGEFGERMQREVRLISITVDPAQDAPAALRDYAARLKAGPGWYFLTGTPAQVNEALRRIGQYAATPDDHMDLLIAGNDRSGMWKKVFALAEPAQIHAAVMSVADDAP